MLKSRVITGMVSIGVMALGAGVTFGQDYPNKPIRIVTTAAGSGNDFTVRLIARGLTENIGQQVLTDNREGSPARPAEVVVKSSPNGYTLLIHGAGLWLAQFLQDKVSYDPERDLSPITLAVTSPHIVVVNPSVPAKSVQELIALAKAKPGELNYGSGVPGSSSYLDGALFNSMANVNIVNVPYPLGSRQLIDLLAGRVQLIFAPPGLVSASIKEGKLRPLAVTSAVPSVLFPNLPTIAASGVPGYESVSTVGVFAPAKTPESIIKRLNQEIVRVLNRADVKERFQQSGIETVGSSPEALAAKMKSETARMGKVIKDANIRGGHS